MVAGKIALGYNHKSWHKRTNNKELFRKSDEQGRLMNSSVIGSKS